ncbi:hypothetical protein CHH26_09855 [Qipengyuania flava]|nr:hypothetical protein CHH26_09855 [Qipengyuania flava]
MPRRFDELNVAWPKVIAIGLTRIDAIRGPGNQGRASRNAFDDPAKDICPAFRSIKDRMGLAEAWAFV